MNKRRYTKPQLEEFKLDIKINLQQASEGGPPDPGGPPQGAAQQQSSSFEENPFDESNLK